MHKLTYILLFILSVVSACSIASDSDLPDDITSGVFDEACIPPIKAFAFPVNELRAELSDEQILPPSPWQVEIGLPETPNGGEFSYDHISFARSRAGYSEIWVKRQVDFGRKGIQPIPKVQILVYRTDIEEWKLIPETFDKNSAKSGSIYLEKDGTIWAEFAFSNPETGYFAVFNEADGAFNYLKNGKSIPSGNRLLDGNGIFWIIHDGVYSFNPDSGEITQHISIPNLNNYSSLYSSMATFAPDDSIYFVNVTGDQKAELLHFSTKTGNIDSENLSNAFYYLADMAYSLFVDRSGKLWVSDLGWMEPNGTWYKIIRSPIFITDRAESGNKYTWVYPSIVHESSTGLLWFHSENGMAYLNPEKEIWCWFTTEQSNIVEDREGNLWMIAEDNLYRLSLGTNSQP